MRKFDLLISALITSVLVSSCRYDLLNTNFNSDTVGLIPNKNLNGHPDGDSLLYKNNSRVKIVSIPAQGTTEAHNALEFNDPPCPPLTNMEGSIIFKPISDDTVKKLDVFWSGKFVRSTIVTSEMDEVVFSVFSESTKTEITRLFFWNRDIFSISNGVIGISYNTRDGKTIALTDAFIGKINDFNQVHNINYSFDLVSQTVNLRIEGVGITNSNSAIVSTPGIVEINIPINAIFIEEINGAKVLPKLNLSCFWKNENKGHKYIVDYLTFRKVKP